MRDTSSRRRCPRCHARGPHVTSVQSGDGRRKFVCQCGHWWTEGDKRKRKDGA